MARKKDDSAALDELRVLFPKREKIEAVLLPLAGSDEYERATAVIGPMAIEQLGPAVLVLDSIRDEIDRTPNFLRVCMTYPAAMNELLVIALGWEPERVKRLHSDSFLQLVTAVFGANRNVFHLFLGLAASASPATTKPTQANGAGEHSSITSSGAAIQTPGDSPQSRPSSI